MSGEGKRGGRRKVCARPCSSWYGNRQKNLRGKKGSYQANRQEGERETFGEINTCMLLLFFFFWPFLTPSFSPFSLLHAGRWVRKKRRGKELKWTTKRMALLLLPGEKFFGPLLSRPPPPHPPSQHPSELFLPSQQHQLSNYTAVQLSDYRKSLEKKVLNRKWKFVWSFREIDWRKISLRKKLSEKRPPFILTTHASFKGKQEILHNARRQKFKI